MLQQLEVEGFPLHNLTPTGAWFVGVHPQVIKPSLLSNSCQCSLIQCSCSGLESDIPKWPRLQWDTTVFSYPIVLTVGSCVPKYLAEDAWATKFSQWAWKPDFFPWFVIANWRGVHTWLWLVMREITQYPFRHFSIFLFFCSFSFTSSILLI